MNGEKLDAVDLVAKLNELGGANGIGIADMVENRLVGMKSRGVYETPGGTILYHAHNKLEETLPGSGDTTHYKQSRSPISLPSWCTTASGSPRCARRSPRLWTSTQQTVTGDVKLKLYKGNIIDAGVTSPYQPVQ